MWADVCMREREEKERKREMCLKVRAGCISSTHVFESKGWINAIRRTYYATVAVLSS